MWALVKDGQIEKVFEYPQSFRDNNGVLHPSNIFEVWTEQELKDISVYPVENEGAEQPSRFHVHTGYDYTFDGTKVVRTSIWTPIELEVAKESALLTIEEWKRGHQDSTFEWNDAWWQCDQRSRDFILGRSLDAFIAVMTLQEDYTVTFRDADNVDHVLTAQQMIELGRAAAAHVQYWHDQAVIKKNAVKEAEDLETLVQILEELE